VSNLKSSILVLVFIGTAFAWGYKGNTATPSQAKTLKQDTAISKINTNSNKSKQIIKSKLKKPTPSISNLGKGFKGTNTIDNAKVPGYVKNYHQKRQSTANTSSASQPQKNPYAHFIKSLNNRNQRVPEQGFNGQRESLGENVKDFKQAPITEGRRQRRNAYFDKLSEQLKQLQGNKGGPVGESDKEEATPSPANNEAIKEATPEVQNEELEIEAPELEDNLPEDDFIENEIIDDEIQDFLDNPDLLDPEL